MLKLKKFTQCKVEFPGAKGERCCSRGIQMLTEENLINTINIVKSN